MDAYTALAQIALGGVVGAAGQGIRVVVGLKKQYDEASQAGKNITDVMETSRLVVSLIIGLIIGGIAGILGALETLGDGEITKAAVMALLAIGYAGTDFIEGFMQRQMPSKPLPSTSPVSPLMLQPLTSNFVTSPSGVAVASPIAIWFNRLKGIQSRMKTLNTQTKSNCKDFSKQTLKDLLTSQSIIENLNVYCQKNLDINVPNDAYSDMGKLFFWFVDRISLSSIREIVLLLFYEVAKKYRPGLPLPPQDIGDKPLSEVYGPEPFNSNIAMQELHTLLLAWIPLEFYPTNGAPLTNPNTTVNQAIEQILA